MREVQVRSRANALSAIAALVGHLAEVCAAAREMERTGCEVVSASTSPRKAMAEFLDRRHLSRRKPGARYLDLIFDTFRLWALFDTGANFTMVTTALCRALGLIVHPFDRTFQLANGETGKFAGCLPEVVIQLHDRLEVTVRNVRVLEAEYVGLLLGTDVFSEEGNGVLSLVSIVRDGDHTMLTVEVTDKQGKDVVAAPGSGLRVSMPLHRTSRATPAGRGAAASAAKEGSAPRSGGKGGAGGRRDLGEAQRSTMPRDVY